ncbi:DUF4019 domain-containing protein [Caballeronia sp. HLA56]
MNKTRRMCVALSFLALLGRVDYAVGQFSSSGPQSPIVNGSGNEINYWSQEPRKRSKSKVHSYPKETVDQYAIRWLELIDVGDYKAAYVQLHPQQRNMVSEEKFAQVMALYRRNSGPHRNRKWVAGNVVNPPQSRLQDRPEFGAAFATDYLYSHGNDANEIVGVGQRDDGSWSVVEYSCGPCVR